MTREDRGWPTYLFGGRVRTSTVVLIVVFFATFWLYNEYKPPPSEPAQAPASDVVPPGFVPDPNYTWVPRTNVQEPTTTSPTTTSPTTPTESTSPTSTTAPPTVPGIPGLTLPTIPAPLPPSPSPTPSG
jgi:hypothetical protein